MSYQRVDEWDLDEDDKTIHEPKKGDDAPDAETLTEIASFVRKVRDAQKAAKDAKASDRKSVV